MSQMNGIRLTQSQVLELLVEQEGGGGLEMPPIAWLLIQHEGDGGTREGFAAAFGTEVSQLVELIEYVTQSEGEIAEERWQTGVMALKASHLTSHNVLAHTWDDIEAMAINKLANTIQNMKTDGKYEDMLAIAKTANAATRRGRGEGQKGGSGMNVSIQTRMGQGAESSPEIEMRSGDLGTMTLRFSPKIQAQLSNPDRVIEGTAKSDRSKTVKSNDSLQMLRLKETRTIAAEMDKVVAQTELDARVVDAAKKAAEKTAESQVANAFGIGNLFGDAK